MVILRARRPPAGSGWSTRRAGALCWPAARSSLRPTTGPITTSVGAPGSSSAASAAALPSVVRTQRWRAVVASLSSATGSSGIAAGRHQRCGDLRQAPERHVQDDRARAAGERRPVDLARRAAAGAVPGDERDRGRQHAVRQRDAGVGEAADPGRDPRHHPERHAGRGQRERLLAAAPEHERIAALEAQHAQAGARKLDQALVDPELRRARPSGALADRLEAGGRAGERQDLGRHQGVVQDDIGAGQRMGGVQREQAGVARPGADQPDAARREFGELELPPHAASPAR